MVVARHGQLDAGETRFCRATRVGVAAVPGLRNSLGAPDISFADGKYYLYYSVSAFGKNTFCIGVATNTTLNQNSPDFKWVDHGEVIQSIPGHTNWNAIDPNLILDDKGTPYLAFGSFWEGLKLVRLTPDRLGVAESIDDLPTLATRRKTPPAPGAYAPGKFPTNAGGNPIEAPFIFKYGDWYVLFVSIDYCCRGPNSTYKMVVGRSKSVGGPYTDKEGVPLNRGGGTLLLAGDNQWHGVGHNAVARFDGADYLVFHGYDASDERGRAKLRIEKLAWDAECWPSVAPK